jgi:hypothetical protein
MQANPDFDLDLKRGQLKESLARRLLTNDDDRLTVEVKGDFIALRTHNHYVEFECRGHPSGIDVTQADFWFVALEDSTVIGVPVEKVRRLVKEAISSGHVAEMTQGCHPTRGALIPLSRLVT